MRRWYLSLVLCGLVARLATAQSLVFTGNEVTFEKVAFADETLPENQDHIVNGVSITRGVTRGIYNIALEEAFVDFTSPAGTAWAFPNNNPDVTLSAANCADGCDEYVFEDWQTANGGGGGGPPATVGQAAILHLIDQDIYLDIRFTSWAAGATSGGGFSYERAAITPTADFDRNGDVDGRDFLIWQRSYGAVDALQSLGDADFDGVVSDDDLVVWQNSYGSPLFNLSAVPEPGSVFLTATGVLILAAQRSRNAQLPNVR